MRRIAIFASGNGSNAQNIIEYSRANHTPWQVVLIVTDNPNAGVIHRAETLGVEVEVWSRKEIDSDPRFAQALLRHSIDGIVLAGYLGLVPQYLIERYPDSIINIHPALLPHYGGRGMYGDRVHKAVIEAQESYSGITIHLVNEAYDQGAILCQVTCPVLSDDSPEALATRVHRLEYIYFPIVIDDYCRRES